MSINDDNSTVAVEVLLKTRGNLEEERRQLLAQSAIRTKAIEQLNSTIAILRGVELSDTEPQNPPSLRRVQPRRNNSAINTAELAGWVWEFAQAQVKPFKSRQVAEWLETSGKLTKATGHVQHKVNQVLQADSRMEMLGSFANTQWKLRDGLGGKVAQALKA